MRRNRHFVKYIKSMNIIDSYSAQNGSALRDGYREIFIQCCGGGDTHFACTGTTEVFSEALPDLELDCEWVLTVRLGYYSFSFGAAEFTFGDTGYDIQDTINEIYEGVARFTYHEETNTLTGELLLDCTNASAYTLLMDYIPC